MTETKTSAKPTKPVVVDAADYEYSKGLENFQKAEKNYAESLQTLSDAVKQGIDAYLDERAKSASEKKDGAMEDLFVNSAKGVSVAVESGSKAIYDVAKSVDSYILTDRQRKDLKRTIRSFANFRTPLPLPVPFLMGYDDDDEDDD